MTDLLKQQTKKWITDNLNHVSARNPVSIHIDELMGREIKKSKIVSISLQAFATLVEQLRELETPVQPSIVIPLVTLSKKLERAVPPDRKSIETQLDIEPPSLYLFDWSPSRYFEVCEEYRCPLTFSLIDDHSQGIYVCYKEVRYAAAIENDWEFARGIYVEYYPEKPVF